MSDDPFHGHKPSPHVDEEPKTYTVRELITALANTESLDSLVHIQIPALRMEPIPVNGVDYDAENEQFILNA